MSKNKMLYDYPPPINDEEILMKTVPTNHPFATQIRILSLAGLLKTQRLFNCPAHPTDKTPVELSDLDDRSLE